MITKYILDLDDCDTRLVQVTTHYYSHPRGALAFFHSRLSSWNQSVQVNLPLSLSSRLPHGVRAFATLWLCCTSGSQHSLLPPTCTILAVFVPFQFLEHPSTFLLSASTLTLFSLPGVLTLALCMVDGIPCSTP